MGGRKRGKAREKARERGSEGVREGGKEDERKLLIPPVYMLRVRSNSMNLITVMWLW